MSKSHNELKVFRHTSGMFDVGKTELDKYIGMKVQKIRNDDSFWGRRVFIIGEIQKIYDGTLAFRLYQCEDLILSDEECQSIGEKPGYVYPASCNAARFGCPARLDEVVFVAEEG